MLFNRNRKRGTCRNKVHNTTVLKVFAPKAQSLSVQPTQNSVSTCKANTHCVSVPLRRHTYLHVRMWLEYIDSKGAVEWGSGSFCLITGPQRILTHIFCQQGASGGAGEALGWAQAVFWCKWPISSPRVFQAPSEGNKDCCLPTYLLRFNTVSVVAASNTFPSFVFSVPTVSSHCFMWCDIWIRGIRRVSQPDTEMSIRDYVWWLHLVITLGGISFIVQLRLKFNVGFSSPSNLITI